MDINTTKYKWTQDKSEYTELIFEMYLVLPSWEDQKKQVGFLIITHEITKPWYSFNKKKKKFRHYLSTAPLKICIQPRHLLGKDKLPH